MCGSVERAPRHAGLADDLYHAASGTWDIARCSACGLHYVDPRPTPASMHRHYTTYYTHGEAGADRPPDLPPDLLADLPPRLRGCAGDWLLQRHGLRSPSRRLPGGRWAMALFPDVRRTLDCACRHRLPPRPAAGLLDIGCGNGADVPLARALGWEVSGLEPDPLAVAAAQARGYAVRQGGLPQTGCADASYAAVTLNHVLEHLHDPVAALRDVLRILEPGGWAWIATPNADSFSHRHFGRHWRGLEPPRHLAIFSARALRQAVMAAGFQSCRLLPPRLMSQWYAQSSADLAASTGATPELPGSLQLLRATLRALYRRDAGEELYLMAFKARARA